MVPRLVPEIEGGYPERDGEEGEEGEGGEGLVLEYSRSWMTHSGLSYIDSWKSTIFDYPKNRLV